MSVSSQKINEIIKSPLAKRGLSYITPIYENAYVALWLMEAIGKEFDSFVDWSDAYHKQVIPQTATWGLGLYEEEYGLPINTELPLEERRQSVLLAIRSRAPMNPYKMENIVGIAAGYPVEVIENTSKNAFTIRALDTGKESLTEKIKETVNKIKPAHIIYSIIVKPPPYVFCNGQNADLKRILFYMRLSNLGIKEIRLNGEKNVDGTWKLMRYFLKGIAIYSQTMSTRCSQFSRCQQKAFLTMTVFSVNSEKGSFTHFKIQTRRKEKVCGAVSEMIIKAGAKALETVSVFVTVDTLYYINGEVLLNGTKKLNADIIRSECK